MEVERAQLHKDYEHVCLELAALQQNIQNERKAFDTQRDQFALEKRELQIRCEKDRYEVVDKTEQNFNMKLNSLKQINDQLNGRLFEAQAAEEDLINTQRDLKGCEATITRMKAEIHSFTKQCMTLENKSEQLENELKEAQTALVNAEDTSRNRYEESVLALQM